MAIRFQCVCGRRFKTPDDATGKKAKCPKCNRWLRIPDSNTYDTNAEETSAPSKKDTARPAVSPVGSRASGTSPSGGEAGPAVAPNKGRVVIADENEADLKTLSLLLSEHGYDVLETANGNTAVDLVRESDPVAVVLDVHLDGLSGFQVVKQIHDPASESNLHVWSVPVLMTTDKVRGRDKQYAISLGVAGYFEKPIVPSKFCHRLEREAVGYRPQ